MGRRGGGGHHHHHHHHYHNRCFKPKTTTFFSPASAAPSTKRIGINGDKCKYSTDQFSKPLDKLTRRTIGRIHSG